MIPLFSVFMSQDVDAGVLETLHSGFIGQGQRVEEFERLFSTVVRNPLVLSVNSGTSALVLALRLAGVEHGSHVVTTPATCTATTNAILAAGGQLVWADVNPVTGLIDPNDVDRCITPQTKAIMCVDWGGTPCDLDALMEIGRRRGIPVIEDAAHAQGALYKDKPVGSGLVDYTMFSFQAIKHINTIDGGMLCVTSLKDYKRGKLLRWYGLDRETGKTQMRCEDPILEWGWKFHMNDVNATVGLHQLPHLQSVVNRHRDNARYYQDGLDEYFAKPIAENLLYDATSSYWLYTIRLPSEERRVAFAQHMLQNYVHVSQVHARNTVHPAFMENTVNPLHALPGVDEFYQRMICLPVHQGLSQQQLDCIVKNANAFIRRI